MLRDEQTHTMPETPEGVSTIARLMDEPDLTAFEARYRAALNLVMNYYAELFSEQESLGGAGGNLVFTGSDDDPETLETLGRMGFADPSKASATVRKWHYGGYPATRAAAARAHLTELLPALLKAIASAGDADGNARAVRSISCSRDCHPASSFSPFCAATSNCSTCWSRFSPPPLVLPKR